MIFSFFVFLSVSSLDLFCPFFVPSILLSGLANIKGKEWKETDTEGTEIKSQVMQSILSLFCRKCPVPKNTSAKLGSL